MKQGILVLDFGSQYTRLIARRIRDLDVYSEIVPYDISIETIREKDPSGLIFSGGPESIYGDNVPVCSEDILKAGIPVLGICYGMHLMVDTLGGEVTGSGQREYGHTKINIEKNSALFKDLNKRQEVWMSHGDRIREIPEGFVVTGVSGDGIPAVVEHTEKCLYGIQFHPEVEHTQNGMEILSNFLFPVCNAPKDWKMESFIERAVEDIKQRSSGAQAICGLSGGVDSSVSAALSHRALGESLQCIFVDTGLLRYNEATEVMKAYSEDMDLNVMKVDASEKFYRHLRGVRDPEEKRKIIGELFIEIFQEKASEIEGGEYLIQGTLYPDVIESASSDGPASTIKTHHNVGGLPDTLELKLIEPLRELFKDEVREIGKMLGLKDKFVWRHPFPGPGLAVRITGEVTPERVSLLQKADNIFIKAIKDAGLYREIAQAFAVLLPVRSVGVMGDERTYEYVLALRAVKTKDFMTADWFRFPDELLNRIATDITNRVEGINRVVYDISTKPPATIEWE